MTSPVVPLASNDLFGGAHLGQHAERIQAAQPFKYRRQLLAAQARKAACKETRSDSTSLHIIRRWSKGTKPLTFAMRNCFPKIKPSTSATTKLSIFLGREPPNG